MAAPMVRREESLPEAEIRNIDLGDGPAAAAGLTITAAVEMFFGDLRLAPRSKKTYRHGVDKFLRHLAQHEGIDPETAPVTALTAEHVTSFASVIVPPDVRSPEEVSRMRTAQNNISAVRKFCAYLASYDMNPNLSVDRIRTRISAMMPRFTPPPPDVKLSDLETIVELVEKLPREEKAHLELRRLKVQAMIRFLVRSGVRVSELCALRRRDIDLAGGTANIYRAKGGKSRTVHFDNGTAEALTAYWAGRGDPVRGAGALPA
ncbi:MAG: tyrosine-type recombinase/integrase, partial [Thermomicrobiales bacterium]